MMRTSVLPSVVLRRGLLAGAAITATLVLSACGGDDSSSGSGMDHSGMTTSAAPSSVTAVNDVDVTFAQSMIKHHQQAIQMAALADSRAADTDVKQLAATIQKAQDPEIDTMTKWLTAWGQAEPMPSMTSSMPDMDHGSMPGEMTEADMNKLMSAQRRGIRQAVPHHDDQPPRRCDRDGPARGRPGLEP
ncbi:DUF305 domain-containing protein [Actinoplanes solisilvae]|uniref:DUF305 domain-containing protein n=1 Tax=Actinoplanes solisilvae TaxID=2486853 RepID=UPI0032C469B0